MTTLQLLQLNIERDKHFDRIIPFLAEHKPDVVCVQEISEHSVPRLESLGYTSYFVPMNNREAEEGRFVQGVALFSLAPMHRTWAVQYGGPIGDLPEYRDESEAIKHDSQQYVAIFGEVTKDGTLFRIGTTHFPWTAGGEASDFQRADMQNLISVLDEIGSFVFTGDFNAPRGGEIFSLLAKSYKDDVPAQYTSSIDGSLHKAGPLPYMVDGIFSTPDYHVSDVTMHTGVSDHCALTATVSVE